MTGMSGGTASNTFCCTDAAGITSYRTACSICRTADAGPRGLAISPAAAVPVERHLGRRSGVLPRIRSAAFSAIIITGA